MDFKGTKNKGMHIQGLCMFRSLSAAILVGFQDQEYTFAEGGDGTATVLIRRGAVSDVPFTVEVSAGKDQLNKCLVDSQSYIY